VVSPQPHTLTFPTPPPTRLLRAALHRPRPGGAPLQIPRIVVEIERAVLLDDAAYRRLCGFVGKGPPLTAPHLLAGSAHIAIVSHPAMPLPSMGLVHMRNTIVAHRPLAAGAVLRLRVHTEGHHPVRAGVEFDVHTAACIGDEVVWEEVSTYLSRAVEGTGEARAPEPEPLKSPIISTPWRLPSDLGRRYAHASGDYNPIHLTSLTARAFGFPRAIIHGMWTLARAAAQLELPQPATLRCTFSRPALLPSTVIFSADASGCFQVRAARTGKLLLSGEATAR
jgi:acyl dehydratase